MQPKTDGLGSLLLTIISNFHAGRHQNLNGSISELGRDMQSWVSMLESLLDKQRTTASSITSVPREELQQRDNTAAMEPPQQMSLGSRLQETSDPKIQNLFNQYPQISETFKPVEQFLANFTKLQTSTNAPNSWSNYQYQTNPVFPYQQDTTGIQEDTRQNGTPQTSILQDNFPKAFQPNQFNSFNSDARETVQNNNQVTENQQDYQGVKSGSTGDNPTGAPYPGFYWSPTQTYQSDWRNAAQFAPSVPSQKSLDMREDVKATGKPIRAWPTPKPFNYNMELLRMYQERALEKQLLQNEMLSRKPAIPQADPLSKQASLVKGFNTKNPETKPFPAIKIAPFSGNAKKQDSRVHPWPFALKIKVIPPDGGNYIMRIKGPLDSLAGSASKDSTAEGRSKGLPKSSIHQVVAGNMNAKYITPINRNYQFQAKTEQTNNPIVYLKVPRNHQKFIELTTSFPNNEEKLSTAAIGQTKDKVVSMKLPFNVSLATVLKNIYENMFANYLNKKPSEVMKEEIGKETRNNAVSLSAAKWPNQKTYPNFGNKGTAMFRGQTPQQSIKSFFKIQKNVLGVPSLSQHVSNLKPFNGAKKDRTPLNQRGNLGLNFEKLKALESARGHAKSISFMKEKNNPAMQYKVKSSMITRDKQYQIPNKGNNQPLNRFDWKRVYEKLKNVNLPKPNQAINSIQYRNSYPKKDTAKKDNDFPESIKVRLYPGSGFDIKKFAKKFTSNKNQGTMQGKATKQSYFAQLEINRPITGTKLTDAKGNPVASKRHNTWKATPGFEQLLKAQIQRKKHVPQVFPYQKIVSPLTSLANVLPYQQWPPSLLQRQMTRQFSHQQVAKKLGHRVGLPIYRDRSDIIKFGQMKVPYHYLKNPISIGPKLKLVPVISTGDNGKSTKLKSDTAIITQQQKGNMNVERRFPLNSLQAPSQKKKASNYASQIQMLRELQNSRERKTLQTVLNPVNQAQINLRNYEKFKIFSGTLPKNKISANLPRAYTPGSQPGRGPPLIDRLNHGLPKIASKSPKVKEKLDTEVSKNKNGKYEKESGKSGQAQKEAVVGVYPVSIVNKQTENTVNSGPIFLTEKAQTRSTMVPLNTVENNSDAREKIKESSRILTQFLKETAPIDSENWGKTNFGIPSSNQVEDSEIVSRSTIPRSNSNMLSDDDIVKKRKHFLNNRLVRLKRKGNEGWTQAVKSRTLQRSKRL